MSEYQYYEFQAVDRPLTPEEQRAAAKLSSRTEPHPWRAVFTYNWSDFPADAQEILAQYYDAMLYLANLRKFVGLFDVDPAMIQSAAERSARLETPALSEENLREAIAQLSPEEQEDFLGVSFTPFVWRRTNCVPRWL